MIVADIPAELRPIARRFAQTPEFASSPLYTSLARVVARAPALLRLAARGRPVCRPKRTSVRGSSTCAPVPMDGQ